jgi:hypothetical protein
VCLPFGCAITWLPHAKEMAILGEADDGCSLLVRQEAAGRRLDWPGLRSDTLFIAALRLRGAKLELNPSQYQCGFAVGESQAGIVRPADASSDRTFQGAACTRRPGRHSRSRRCFVFEKYMYVEDASPRAAAARTDGL